MNQREKMFFISLLTSCPRADNADASAFAALLQGSF
jgi:hypothetical protein